MLGFFKGLFGKKDAAAGFNFYKPPPGTEIRDLNFGAVIGGANDGGHDGLMLHGVELTAKGIGKLSSMKSLRALDLKDAKVDDTAMAALKGRTSLEWLNLSGTEVAGACFVKIGPLPNLVHLDLSRTKTVDMALLALRNCPKLLELDLSETKLTDQAIDYIGQLKNLQVLTVKGMNLDGAAMAMLTHGKELKIVD